MGRLSPDAEPFIPAAAAIAASKGGNEEDRSLYMTFSNGSPLTWQEISLHFTSQYGEGCVEYVYVHRRNDGVADFGKIIFTRLGIANMIMNKEQVVRVLVNGKHLWLKKYVPPQQRRTTTCNKN